MELDSAKVGGTKSSFDVIYKWCPSSLKFIRGAIYCESVFQVWDAASPTSATESSSVAEDSSRRRISLPANNVTNWIILSLDPDRLLLSSPTTPKIWLDYHFENWTPVGVQISTVPKWVCQRGGWESTSVTCRIYVWKHFREFDIRKMETMQHL